MSFQTPQVSGPGDSSGLGGDDRSPLDVFPTPVAISKDEVAAKVRELLFDTPEDHGIVGDVVRTCEYLITLAQDRGGLGLDVMESALGIDRLRLLCDTHRSLICGKVRPTLVSVSAFSYFAYSYIIILH
ncbi:hypothetical protein KIPB_012521 [Kipferlia bialata]|uniref:Uncharacterized protein n=1 Tax=Kipferlia bialata TaxID=797122 RepID=A0A391P082_9EUKA|nr:hypothetical protein KIPB_012521 [Kipferlia bialata]|eukprot:g12521.t1